MNSSLIYSFKLKINPFELIRQSSSVCSQQWCNFRVILLQKIIHLAMGKDIYISVTLFMLFIDAVSDLRNAWRVRVPHLWDGFNKENETDSEHSKILHFSETVYLISYVHFSGFFFSFFFVSFVNSLIFLHHILFLRSFSLSYLHITLLTWQNLHLIMVRCRRRNLNQIFYFRRIEVRLVRQLLDFTGYIPFSSLGTERVADHRKPPSETFAALFVVALVALVGINQRVHVASGKKLAIPRIFILTT